MSTDRIAQFLLLAALAAALAPASAGAQASTRTADSVAALDAASIRVTAIEISPAVLRLARGDTVTFQGVLRDSAGAVVRGARWGVTTEDVFAVQSIKDREPDTYRIWGLLPGRGTLGVFLGLPGETPDEPNWVQLTSVEVEVEDYPVDRVEIAGLPYAPYAGTSFRLDARAITTAGTVHVSERVRWSSPDPAVASVDPDGVLTLHAPGRVVLRATAADRSSSVVVTSWTIRWPG